MKRQRKRPVSAPAAAGGEIAPRAIAGGNWWLGLFLLAAPLIAYWPALHGGFVWDDEAHITECQPLRSLAGLREIWFQPGATCQYYPLSFTCFWVGYHLWGLNPLGYHLLNVGLHGLVAVLLWQVLARLKVRGAGLAGAIFALHPVCVMSVAWMTELKNTLSAALALGAVWAYVRFARLGVYERSGGVKSDWRFYGLALGLFGLAMFAKTAVSFMPVTVLLLVWWRRERIGWRDVWPLLPLVGIVAVMGQVTIYVERHSGGAAGATFSLGFWERVLVSGRSFWFYLGKLFFPHPLIFIYPRWLINPALWWQCLFPTATIAVLGGAWLLRGRIGKGLFTALMHFYVSTSFLVLLVVLYMMKFSWVTDHWQYFGCMSVIAAVAAGITAGLDQIGKPFMRTALVTPLLLALGVLTWRQCGMYVNVETFWRTSIARNPNSAMSYGNLGYVLFNQGRFNEAVQTYEHSIQLEPDDAEVHKNLGLVLNTDGRLEKAVEHLERAVQLNPGDAETHNNLGNTLANLGRLDAAIAHYQQALQITPDDAEIHNNLGVALCDQGKRDEGIAQYQRALQLRPDYAEAHNNFGVALCRQEKFEAAIPHFQRALQLKPDYADAHNNLGNALSSQGRFIEAIPHFENTTRLKPEFTSAYFGLGNALEGSGKLREAILQFQRALTQAAAQSNTVLAEVSRARIESCRAALATPRAP